MDTQLNNVNPEVDEQVENSISEQEFFYAQDVIKKLSDYFDAKVVGQQQLKFSLIGSIIADGHILIESVPGLAKTTAAKAISDAVDGKFARIQCTPDLLPGDIIGTQIYNQATGKFENILGPVFANFVLLDDGVNLGDLLGREDVVKALDGRLVVVDVVFRRENGSTDNSDQNSGEKILHFSLPFVLLTSSFSASCLAFFITKNNYL